MKEKQTVFACEQEKLNLKLACKFCARDSGPRQQIFSIPNPCAFYFVSVGSKQVPLALKTSNKRASLAHSTLLEQSLYFDSNITTSACSYSDRNPLFIRLSSTSMISFTRMISTGFADSRSKVRYT